MINLRGSRFTDIMPENLASQLETQAFAYALGRQIEKLCDYADGVHIYADVASMPENILDVLAMELRTPAYNQKFSVKVKRMLVEKTLTFFAHMGTPAACDQIIETIFGNGHIEEWFDYGGEPHHFRAYVGDGKVDLEDLEEFLRVLAFVKRLSSWLDEVIITLPTLHGKLHTLPAIGPRMSRAAPPPYRPRLGPGRIPAACALGTRYSTVTPPMAAYPSTSKEVKADGL